MQVSPIFQRRKSDANKQDFENKLYLTCQAQSTPKTIGILTKVFCTSGPNLVVLAQTGDELSHGQAQNGVNFDFEVKFDFEGQGQSPPKTIGILTKVFYTFGPNLAILAWTGPELSRGQASDWRTDWHTHTRTHPHTDADDDNTRRPKLASGKKHGKINTCYDTRQLKHWKQRDKAWCRHQMEIFSASLTFVRGIHRSPVNSPHKGQWHGALMFSLIGARTNGWANNRDAGDLIRHRAHYNVTVMSKKAMGCMGTMSVILNNIH